VQRSKSTMSEVINVVVAIAVIIFVVRWATSSSESPADKTAREALGFRPKNVTPEMVETVHAMFPDIPQDNIRFDLLRTGNVEVTTNKIIERSYLDAPPAGYYSVYPRTEQQSQARPVAISSAVAPPTSKQPSLVSRFHLESRLADDPSTIPAAPEMAAGKATWEPTPEQREASLKERKAQMILAARQRMLEKQKTATS